MRKSHGPCGQSKDDLRRCYLVPASFNNLCFNIINFFVPIRNAHANHFVSVICDVIILLMHSDVITRSFKKEK